jgi:hypothetical protein
MRLSALIGVFLLLVPVATVCSPARATSANGVVVLELFTSQGCSSCPPADKLIERIGNESFAGTVVPLAWHVDYWDHLGWRDPFSSAEASARQKAYARVLKSQVYTPQMVINGRSQLVGSAEGLIRGELERALEATAHATVTIERASQHDGKMSVAVRSTVDPTLAGRALSLEVVLFERSVATAVRAGENGGRELVNAFIVRRHVSLDARGGAADLPVNSAWRGVGVAAFLQDRQTLAIYAAAKR